MIAANAKALDDSEVTGPYANVMEHRRDAVILRASRLDWTILAAPMLTDDAATGAVVSVVTARLPAAPSPRRLRHDAADATGTEADRHVVGVSNPPVVR